MKRLPYSTLTYKQN